jgi:restriction system protein
MEPILRYLAATPDGAPARDVYEAAATTLGLTDTDRTELLPSGTQAVYKNRARWAHDRLKRHGLSSSVRRGVWKLTDAGREFTAAHSAPLTDEIVERLAADKSDVRLRTDGTPIEPPSEVLSGATPTASPDDRLEGALAELRQTVYLAR